MKLDVSISLQLRRWILADTPYLIYYIIVYIELTILVPIMFLIAKSKWKYLFLTISPLAIITLRYLPSILGIDINEHIYRLNGLIWFSFFYLGLLLRNDFIRIERIKTSWLIGCYLFFLMISYVVSAYNLKKC